ncbi:gamma-glutamylcyclotransferase [Sutcliffiella cohnii]
MESTHIVFVYGTLRKNERNHRLLEGSRLIAEQAWTTGVMYDTGLHYPALQKSSTGRVYGELYEVNDHTLSSLDRLEGYQAHRSDNLYDRVSQSINTDKGTYEAYVYIMVNNNMLQRKIHGGDWKVYQLEKKPKFYYFAYGSCMDNERFQLANVDHHFQKVTGKGTLPGYSLRFTWRSLDGGRADIVEEDGVVEGKVYELASDALPYLYDREGVDASCYRPAVIEVEMEEEVLEVLTFIVVHKKDESAPPAHYLKEIIRGGSGFLSNEYLTELKKKFPNVLE